MQRSLTEVLGTEDGGRGGDPLGSAQATTECVAGCAKIGSGMTDEDASGGGPGKDLSFSTAFASSALAVLGSDGHGMFPLQTRERDGIVVVVALLQRAVEAQDCAFFLTAAHMLQRRWLHVPRTSSKVPIYEAIDEARFGRVER